MKIIVNVFKELWGLLVEDSSFAAAKIVWLAIVWFVVARYAPDDYKGGILFLGLALVMLENVWRTARTKAR